MFHIKALCSQADPVHSIPVNCLCPKKNKASLLCPLSTGASVCLTSTEAGRQEASLLEVHFKGGSKAPRKDSPEMQTGLFSF